MKFKTKSIALLEYALILEIINFVVLKGGSSEKVEKKTFYYISVISNIFHKAKILFENKKFLANC